MPTRSDIIYFGAGPAWLPTDVLEDASAVLLNYEGTGLGLAEHSHRAAHATRIIQDAKADLAAFLRFPAAGPDSAPQQHDVLFMQGGGTGGFAASAYNMVGAWVARHHAAVLAELGLAKSVDAAAPESDEVVAALRARVAAKLRLDYVVIGSWSLKAYHEAHRLFGPELVRVAADARDCRRPDGQAAGAAEAAFGRIPPPAAWSLSEDPAMVYYCDNETVDGIEFPGFPDPLLPPAAGAGAAAQHNDDDDDDHDNDHHRQHPSVVVADMSSNILSRRFDVARYGVVFFGAQKNLGSTGVTVAVVDKRLLPQPSPSLMRKLGLPVPPVVLQYETVAKNNSLYNTLSIFDVYIAGQVLKRLLQTFPDDKVDGQQALAGRKAALIYAGLDAHPTVYRVVPDRAARSRMNICFRVIKNGQTAERAEKAFLEQAEKLGLMGLKGHRSVGGIRASNYNAVPLEGAEKLVRFIQNFAKTG